MSVVLRTIGEQDLEKIMYWRMDPDITKYMNTDPVLDINKQREWLKRIRGDLSVQYWMIEKDFTPIGIINLLDIDWKNKNSSWGYYIGEKSQRSLATAISLELSLYEYVFDVLGFNELHNEVLSINEGVVQLHKACGSRVVAVGKAEVIKNAMAYDVVHMSIGKDKWDAIKSNKRYEKIDFCSFMRIHHIAYATTNISLSIKKYRLLGYREETSVFEDVSRNVNISFLKHMYDNTRIELVQPINEESPVSFLLKNQKNVPTPYHICYEVDNLEWAINYLKNQGFAVTIPPAPAIAFEMKRVCFLIHRMAGLIEIVEADNN